MKIIDFIIRRQTKLVKKTQGFRYLKRKLILRGGRVSFYYNCLGMSFPDPFSRAGDALLEAENRKNWKQKKEALEDTYDNVKEEI